MMPQYADFMYNIGMLDERQRDYFQKFALQAVTAIQQKNFRAAFEVRLLFLIPLSSKEEIPKDMSWAMRKCILCHIRTTKLQINLRIRAV